MTIFQPKIGKTCPKCKNRDYTYYVDEGQCVECLLKEHDKLAQLTPSTHVVHGKPCPGGPHLLTTLKGRKRCLICKTPRQQAIDRGESWYMPKEPCPHCGTRALKRVSNGECESCHPPSSRPQSPRQQALRAGESWYMPKEPCPHCNTLSLKRVVSGECKGCRPAPSRPQSPRQQALRAGETWYTPVQPCPHCNTLSLKRVYDGACQGCTGSIGLHGDEHLPDDLLIDKKTAADLGLRVYRDGTYCKRRGHNGFKMVGNNHCVECKRN